MPRTASSQTETLIDATVPSQGSLERITTERLASATAGEFDILERLGYGAMGSVYLARDVALSRRVAIKVIAPHLLEDESVVARFRLEAQTVAALRHPSIVNLYGVREFGDLHYFIMDFIDGPSLRSLMKAHAPLDIPVVQALLFQIGGALHYAHLRGRGVIHRDVKPANVMVDLEGHAVVMDFGISRVGEGRSGLTQTGATIGTPEYMSPEQCMDRELTGASDQYALGIVAYEMLTGRVPFTGSAYAIMMAHASSPPPSITAQRSDCPPQVEAAVMRMLAKSPAERFSDMEAAVAGLGGRPLGPSDPIQNAIIELAESISSDLVALDDSSPLSPVPGTAAHETITIMGLPDIVEPGDKFDLGVESRRGTGPARDATDVTWFTSDPAVASVEDGAVRAKAPGSVSLTATVGAVASTVILSVRERRSTEVSLRPRTVLIEAGGSIPLQAEVVDRKGEPLRTPLVWSTEDAGIAMVSQDGMVTAVASGSTQITVDADSVKASAEIEVQQAAVHELSITDVPGVIQVGDELALHVLVADSGGAALERTVTWHSDQPKVVAIQGGRPVAVATGSATLRAECGGRTASIQVEVDLAPVASIAIAGAPDAPAKGDRFALQAVLLDRSGKALIREVTWSSNDPSIASVSDAGDVHVEAAGRVEISASSGDVSELVILDVTGAPMAAAGAVGLARPARSRTGGRSAAAESAAALARASRAARKKRSRARWVGLVALIGIAFGLTQVLGRDGDAPAGSTTTAARGADTPATDDSLASGPAAVVDAASDPPGRPSTAETAGDPAGEVSPAIDEAVASVRIEGGARVLEAGTSRTLTATALNASGQRVDAPSVEWRSSDPRVARVDGGRVEATGAGRATISASIAGVRGRFDVTVEAPTLELPGREQALQQVQRFVNSLQNANAAAISRIFGRGARGSDELITRMRAGDFSARLVRLGQPELTTDGAAVEFDIEMSWRDARGAQSRRGVRLIASLRPSPSGWRLAGVSEPVNDNGTLMGIN